MPKTKAQKREILDSITDKIGKSKSVIFTKFNGLTVKENEELRKKLKNEAGEYYVAKKTLFDLAFKEAKIAGLEIKKFTGQIAAVFGYGDEVAPARIIDIYKRDKEEKIVFAGGILENKFLNKDQISELAKLPSKQELLAKVVGTINAPVSGFVNVLAGNLRGLVNVLKAVVEKK